MADSTVTPAPTTQVSGEHALNLIDRAELALGHAKNVLDLLESYGIRHGLSQAINSAIDKLNDINKDTCEPNPAPPTTEPVPPVTDVTPPVVPPATGVTPPVTPPVVPPTTTTPPVVPPTTTTPPVVPPTTTTPPVVPPTTTTPPVVPPTTTTPPVTTIKYAPARTPVSGTYNLYGINMDWKDKAGPGLPKVTAACNGAAQIYKELSGGKFIYKPIPSSVKVDYTYNKANLDKAEAQAKKVATGGKSVKGDHFAIVNSGVKGFSNASGDTAHLYGALLRDWLHELGHLRPTSLGHSGVYENGQLKAYNDGTSFMGKFASTKLTASQLYQLGWLAKNKVAQHDLTAPTTEYKVENLYGKSVTDGVKAVLIPTPGRSLFLSVPSISNKNIPALHLSTGGGSQRVAVFGDKTDYDNFTFEKTGTAPSYQTIRISTKK